MIFVSVKEKIERGCYFFFFAKIENSESRRCIAGGNEGIFFVFLRVRSKF